MAHSQTGVIVRSIFLMFIAFLSGMVLADDFRGMRKPGMAGSGWTKFGQSTYCMVPDGDQIDLITFHKYQDFELEFSWWLAEGGNSGVKYHIEEQTGSVGFEMQLLDNENHPDAKVGRRRQTGALYDILAPDVEPLFAIGEWNTAKIVHRSGVIEHWINEVLVLRFSTDDERLRTGFRDSKFRKIDWFFQRKTGHLLFQDHGDRVCFREIKFLK